MKVEGKKYIIHNNTHPGLLYTPELLLTALSAQCNVQSYIETLDAYDI